MKFVGNKKEDFTWKVIVKELIQFSILCMLTVFCWNRSIGPTLLEDTRCEVVGKTMKLDGGYHSTVRTEYDLVVMPVGTSTYVDIDVSASVWERYDKGDIGVFKIDPTSYKGHPYSVPVQIFCIIGWLIFFSMVGAYVLQFIYCVVEYIWKKWEKIWE
jgi:hypothetical protein